MIFLFCVWPAELFQLFVLVRSYMVAKSEIPGAVALSYPPRVRVRSTAKFSAAFFHDESSIIIGGGVRKCNSATNPSVMVFLNNL